MQAEAQAAAELWERISALARGLSASDWARPTPCERWDVHDVLAHVAGLQTAFDQTAPQPSPPEGWSPDDGWSPLDTATEASVAARREWTPQQILDELDVAADGHVARLEAADPDAETMGPLGPTDMRRLYGVRMFDLWTHLQDLTVALGGSADAADPSAAARDAYRYVFDTVPYLAVKRVGLDDGQRLHVTLDEPMPFDGVLEVTGRRGSWRDDGADPAGDIPDRVHARPGALTLLLAGRGTPDDWRAGGALDWSGDVADAFVARARLFAA